MAGPGGPALVWCPCPDADEAARLAEALLDEKLIACANLFPGLRSLYDWNGERGEAQEAGMLLKTDAALLPRLLARISALHPYDAPAVLAWRCDAATPGTAAWLGGLVR